ncbi:SixA phosphatase family protein [Botrimarina hoheduenensis]|uniref:Phosphohistidine phosphatase SixA n=1 Tax=Botrimarina hoheduenensis TaxID=2528000 RepID=A0A5C5W8J0_9BACT|nr:histidine phosphatase family protein [Botrimarina hoheduenensis]TWT46777.1 Phosphohistidine phosphatase SixA [Botrimarina hoheduenensis]
MKVFIARHAWAGNYGDSAWPDDSQRPLTAEGVERYRAVVDTLAERGLIPERIATSPYVRCRQTAELIAAATGAPIDDLPSLAPGADLATLIEWTESTGTESVCWVGHNPDVEILTAALIGDRNAGVRFAKGSIACVRFEEVNLAPGSGVLEWHLTAKTLGL